MSRITCRPRLRQRLRRGENRFVFVAAIGLGLMMTSARGGSLDAPAGPASPASAMYTLENIYKYLTTGVRASKRSGGFTEPTAGPTHGTMHTLNEIMEAGIIPPKTGQTNSDAVGDDGTTRIGLAWPNPRFSKVAESGAATNQIRDNLTGLIWARNANIANGSVFSTTGKVTWSNAFEVISNSSSGLVNHVNYGGTNDWRLPNRHELHSLIALPYSSPALSDGTGTQKWSEARGPFTVVKSDSYWSGTAYVADAGAVCAWTMNLCYGSADAVYKTSTYYVWPVRGGQ